MTLADVMSTCTKSGLTLAMEGARLFLDGDLVNVTDELVATSGTVNNTGPAWSERRMGR